MDISGWLDKGSHFKYKNNKAFYVSDGSGPSLLLLHGFPTSSWDWHKMWPALITHYSLIAPDFIGFGYSDKPKKYSYSLMDQADLVVALINDHKIDNLHILAHDYGDSVVQEILARQNEGSLGFKVSSATLLNGGLFPGVHKPRLIQKLLMTPLGPLLGRLYSKKNFASTFSDIFGKKTQPTTSEIDSFWELMNYNNGRAIVHKLIRYMAERVTHQERWLKSLQESECPIRLINGASDPISGLHLVEHYRKVIPSPDCVILDKIGHYPQVEAPQKVLDAFLEYMKKQSL